MSLTSYRAAPPRVIFAWGAKGDRLAGAGGSDRVIVGSEWGGVSAFGRPGGDRLSRVLRQSTIGAKVFDGRVRDGIGSCHLAKATRPAKRRTGISDQVSVTRRGLSTSPRRRPDRAEPELMCEAKGSEPGMMILAPVALLITDHRLPIPGLVWSSINERDQAERAISTGQLHALLRFHIRPIDVVVDHGSSGRTRFEVGFPLRCLQRLSRPYIATLHCGWRHNRSTRGTFVPVLSY